jgi:hypothetical protein
MYVIRVGEYYFSEGPLDNLRVVVMERKQAENLVKILRASGDEQDIEIERFFDD